MLVVSRIVETRERVGFEVFLNVETAVFFSRSFFVGDLSLQTNFSQNIISPKKHAFSLMFFVVLHKILCMCFILILLFRIWYQCSLDAPP